MVHQEEGQSPEVPVRRDHERWRYATEADSWNTQCQVERRIPKAKEEPNLNQLAQSGERWQLDGMTCGKEDGHDYYHHAEDIKLQG